MSQSDPPYSLWVRKANGAGGWKFVLSGMAKDVVLTESRMRTADPEWLTSLWIGDPGEGPELLKEQGGD